MNHILQACCKLSPYFCTHKILIYVTALTAACISSHLHSQKTPHQVQGSERQRSGILRGQASLVHIRTRRIGTREPARHLYVYHPDLWILSIRLSLALEGGVFDVSWNSSLGQEPIRARTVRELRDNDQSDDCITSICGSTARGVWQNLQPGY
jgi:hypothetical protein